MAVTWKKIAYSDQKLDDFGTPDDNTDLNATNAHHGLLLKLIDDTTKYLRSDGTWQVPAGGGGLSMTVGDTNVFNDTLGANDTWEDLDLSGVVGENEALVMLKVISDNATPRNFAVRRDGDTDDMYPKYYPYGCHMADVSNAGYSVLVVFTSSSGVIEIIAEVAAVTYTVDVMGYIK